MVWDIPYHPDTTALLGCCIAAAIIIKIVNYSFWKKED